MEAELAQDERVVLGGWRLEVGGGFCDIVIKRVLETVLCCAVLCSAVPVLHFCGKARNGCE